MDSSSAAILGAFIGGTAIVGSYVILESYKRHRDRQGTASAFAGEIAAELRMGEARKYVENFTTIAAQLEQGDERPFPAIVSGEHRGPEPALRPLRDRISSAAIGGLSATHIGVRKIACSVLWHGS